MRPSPSTTSGPGSSFPIGQVLYREYDTGSGRYTYVTTFTAPVARDFYAGWMRLLGLVAVACFFFWATSLTPTAHPSIAPYGERLAAQHDCWSNDGQPHPVPVGVVMTRSTDGVARYSERPADVQAALNWAFGQPAPGVYSVVAFCSA